VTCDFSQSGTFGADAQVNAQVIAIGLCAVPWTGLSRIVWSVTATLDLRPFAEILDGELNQTFASVNFYPAVEQEWEPNCLVTALCLPGLMNDVEVKAAMCAVLSACTVTANNLVSLITHETGDKVRLVIFGIPTRSYSISGTFTITKE
jgi:hypothetical protein